jgi:hypothetical protein
VCAVHGGGSDGDDSNESGGDVVIRQGQIKVSTKERSEKQSTEKIQVSIKVMQEENARVNQKGFCGGPRGQ